MKKQDLKTGMRAEMRNGNTLFVYVGVRETTLYGTQNIMFYGIEGFHIGDDYNDDLFDKNDNKFDIVKIYDIPESEGIFLDPEKKGKLLWEREEKIDLTEYCSKTAKHKEYDFYTTILSVSKGVISAVWMGKGLCPIPIEEFNNKYEIID